MSTKDNPSVALSAVQISKPEEVTVGIAVAKWNEDITRNLLQGALDQLHASGINSEMIITKEVPGSFELPLGAQWLIEKAHVSGVICLGSVIKGETDHFTFVCQAASSGTLEVALKYNKPVIFGVLTDNTKQQAVDRSGGKLGNKGVEAAISLIEMINLKNDL